MNDREFIPRQESAVARIETPKAVIVWMRGLVDELAARDDKVYAIAAVGCERLSARDDGEAPGLAPDPISANLFEVIGDQVESTFYKMELHAGITRLAEFLGQRDREGGLPPGQ